MAKSMNELNKPKLKNNLLKNQLSKSLNLPYKAYYKNLKKVMK